MRHARILEGRFALVTGASRGIGRAIAVSLAQAGCHVALASRNSEECRAAAEAIGREIGVRALGLRADVSSQDNVQRLFEDVRLWSEDRLDILVNNAGYPFKPLVWNTPLDETSRDILRSRYMEIFEIDTLSAVFCTFEALPLMKARKHGSILYISSTPALEGFRGTPYTVAKAGVLGLMKDVALEYGAYNIRANALALGSIRTPATFENMDSDAREALAARTPLKRWGLPEEVGQAAVFLASDLSSFVSGQILVVDGGALRR